MPKAPISNAQGVGSSALRTPPISSFESADDPKDMASRMTRKIWLLFTQRPGFDEFVDAVLASVNAETAPCNHYRMKLLHECKKAFTDHKNVLDGVLKALHEPREGVYRPRKGIYNA